MKRGLFWADTAASRRPKHLNFRPSLPASFAGLSEAKKRAYVIADNKLAQLAGWDATLLKDELELLIAENFDIETTGFSTAEIDILFDGAEEPSGR